MQPLSWLFNLSKKKLYYCLTMVVVVICTIGGFMWKENHQAKPITEDVLLVRAMKIGPATAASNYTYSGEVRGRYESQLAFQVGGKVIRRNVDLGSVVNAGDILMQIDTRDVRQSANSGEAARYAAESELQLATNDLKRYQSLYEQGAVSKATYESYVNNYHRAEALLRYATAQYSQGVNQLAYSDLTANAAGVIAGINAEVGQVVSAGQPVLTLVQDGEREIEINVPENRIEELRQAQQIRVSFWALPAMEVEGKIREVSPVADKISRTFKVRISLINPPPKIKLGMTATVALSGTSQQPMVYIPLSAVYQERDNPSVWVVNGEIVNLRPVKLGSYGDAKIQVLAGLNPGETIVTAGVHKLREGQKVRVTGGDSQ